MKRVFYKLRPKKNATGKSAGMQKYYAMTAYDGEITLDHLAEKISRYSTLSRVDIVAVITALVDEIGEGVGKGKIVRLGELGTFRLILNSDGVENVKDFKPSIIKKTRVNFHPGQRIKRVQEKLLFVEDKE